MREIKFRAWNGGMMRYLHDDEFILNKSGIFADCEMGDKGRDRDWPLMQYTGLKDKNGVEIYEGDILKINPEDDDWDDIVVWWEKWARFELKSYVNNPEPHTMVVLGEMQEGNENPAIVIGNIYENPELIANL